MQTDRSRPSCGTARLPNRSRASEKKRAKRHPAPKPSAPPFPPQNVQNMFHHEYVHSFFDGGMPSPGGLFRLSTDPTLPSLSSSPPSPPRPIPS